MTRSAAGQGRRALIVVDVQNDFCEGGSLAVTGGAATATQISERLSPSHGYAAVVATRDHHIDPGAHFADGIPDFVTTWPRHCVAGTPGADFHPGLTFRDFDAIFLKGQHTAAYSGFEGATTNGESLATWLRAHQVSAVDVCGIATDHCVRATALDAAREGFATTVLLDLTAAVRRDGVADVTKQFADAGVAVTGTLPALGTP